ncbi:MAG: CCA tRNA nucleotidyltransferase, partial [Proteobacteria bacterium]|nr:CCA tRNA nucleotidyltransferase [Pseudomonadota bacterium]
MHSPFSAAHRAAARALLDLSTQAGRRLFVVGGMVRDLLRGAPLTDPDLDVVVEGNALEFATQIHPTIGGTLKQFPDFFTAKIVAPFDGTGFAELDFASTRTEHYLQPGALPTIAIASLADDLRRRDFSINAMAVTLADFIQFVEGHLSPASIPVLDPFLGRIDLASKTIRTLHSRSFIDDPTRLFRACRYTARLAGTLAPDTLQSFQEALLAGAITTISRFRVTTEIKKLFLDDASAQALRIADELGLLAASAIVPAACLPPLVEALCNPPSIVREGGDQDRVIFLLTALLAAGGSKTVEQCGVSKKQLRGMQQTVERSLQAPLETLSSVERVLRE